MIAENKINIKKQGEYSGHKSSVYCLAFHQNKLYSAGSDRLVVRWDDVNEGISVASSTSAIYSICFPSKGNVLLLGNADGMIHVIDMVSGKEIRNLKPSATPIFKIIEVAELNKLFVLDGEGSVSVYDSFDLKFLQKIKISSSKLRAIAFDPIRNIVAIGCGEGMVHGIDAISLQMKEKFQAHKRDFSVNALLIHPITNELISGSRDGHINVYAEYDSDSLIRSIPAHNYAVYAMEFIDERYMVSASRDKTLKIWDANDQSFISRIDEQIGGHKYSVNSVCVERKSKHFYSTGDDRLIMDWLIQ